MKKRHEILLTQLKTYRSELLDVVETITEEQAEIIPNRFNNNIRWNLGHIYLDQYMWILAVTKEKLPVSSEYMEWFGFGTSPSNFTPKTPSLSKLKAMLKEQPQQIEELYGERLDDSFAPTEMGMHTIEQVLIRTIFHEGMHLQNILTIRKFIDGQHLA